MDNYLHFRGGPESQQEVRNEMINILAEFLEMPSEDIEHACDEIYRVNSDFAQTRVTKRHNS